MLFRSGGAITNRGLITRNSGVSAGATLAFNAFVQNDNGGVITVTNGIIAFNDINGLGNTGVINITSSGTLQSNSSNSWSNAGTIDLRDGVLRTGGFTNAAVAALFTNTGTVTGFGTIIGGGAYGTTGAGYDKSFVNLGTVLATNPLGTAASTLTIDTGGATSGNGIQNVGNMIVSSNATLNLVRSGGLPILNTGTITINNGTLTGSAALTNISGGLIQATAR